ncbi:ABC transporter substrate-binding protein [Bacillus sp. FJAT-27264]|uniref:menaquinone biosynthetic enzyme MqnA/MqnD family protein n=1 Tax=Paenibacillus sp. (strain DSM 101736 / FJAT-27264) TaxID=1850362 RepID=UPI000807C967|nr:menaquinone biosynthesis protein [Bacillus sp. FJAT-27264]OBZ18783.1 ABC transporter substrate-binding protein [Bacillus sp. FJAT-27264]
MSNSATVIGKISYTNSWPVFHNFHPSSLSHPAKMVSEVPAVLNRGMSEGSIHVGALSSFAYAEASDRLLLLPSLSVSSDGPVRSILLFSRKPLEEIADGIIAVTNTSATSTNLLKIIMQKAIGGRPQYISAEPDLDAMMEQADACLLIGDNAIKASWQNEGYVVTDLGEFWKNWTGLGMTFAVWAVNRDAARNKFAAVAEIAEAFAESKRHGLRDLAPIVSEAMRAVGGTEAYWYGYFRNLCYDFEERQQEGLNLYFRYAYEMGLLPQEVKMELWSHNLLTRVKE